MSVPGLADPRVPIDPKHVLHLPDMGGGGGSLARTCGGVMVQIRASDDCLLAERVGEEDYSSLYTHHYGGPTHHTYTLTSHMYTHSRESLHPVLPFTHTHSLPIPIPHIPPHSSGFRGGRTLKGAECYFLKVAFYPLWPTM